MNNPSSPGIPDNCPTAEEIQAALEWAKWVSYKTHTSILAAAYRREKALREELVEALDELVQSEWMVTHDWGGDRDTVLHKCDAVLAKAKGAGDE